MQERTAEESIASSIIPYSREDARARYLGLRCCGFSPREALKLIGNAKSTLSSWRSDAQFADLENRIPEFRKTLGLEYANLEFLRNYRLVLEKDYRVLKASLYPVKDESGHTLPIPRQDQEYLLKMRSHYTPQQLQMIEALIREEGADGSKFDFTQMVITASRLEQRVRIEAKRGMKEVIGSLKEVGDASALDNYPES